ncbi:MAG TPA: hypothetical protein PKC49_00805 [Phycisphaerae bacterium]|nr:hypothetical protein [Phycisphaerae bacterium]
MRLGIGLLLAGGLLSGAGCGRIHCLFHDDSLATAETPGSATAEDVLGRFEPAAQRQRSWPRQEIGSQYEPVAHGPLYFEDPFEDKGAGRPDQRWGWEDYVALAYCPARHVLNLLAMPVSIVVTPPWTPMESDGHLSRQLLGYDHDATPAAQARRD